MITNLLALALKPLGLSLLLALGGGVLVRARHRAGRLLIGAGFLLLWISAMPWIGTTLLGTLEGQYPPRSAETIPTGEAIVVLGGGIAPAGNYRIYPDLNGAADRIWHAARLHAAGVGPVVIVSGGQAPGATGGPEAPAMKSLLTSWGVPEEAILTEATSGNTHLNAVRTAAICRDRSIGQVVLVTSAAHMPRALATFEQAGLAAYPAPTDYRAGPEPIGIRSFLPTTGGLAQSTQAVHEYLGYAYYWLRGWIG